MKTNEIPQTKADSEGGISIQRKYDVIKLGVDWHASQYRVTRIIDNAGPEPAQKFTPKQFLNWVSKQAGMANKVYTCYEAGAGGYALHRQLTAIGVTNYVVTPRDLDRDHKGIKSDTSDSGQLTLDLDRYVRGNEKALRVVNVPTPENERRRQESRQRRQLRNHRLSLAAQGRSLLLGQGFRESNNWWRSPYWEELQRNLPQWILGALEIFRRLILAVDQEIKAMLKNIAKAAPAHLPKGMGALTHEELDREVGDWNRFKNRKAPGAYAGLTGGVNSSGDRYYDLPITKSGNGRLRTILIELAWRWVVHQKQSKLIVRWGSVLLNPDSHARARKRAIVAVARQLFVDIWKWRTGRATPQDFGWIMTNSEP